MDGDSELLGFLQQTETTGAQKGLRLTVGPGTPGTRYPDNPGTATRRGGYPNTFLCSGKAAAGVQRYVGIPFRVTRNSAQFLFLFFGFSEVGGNSWVLLLVCLYLVTCVRYLGTTEAVPLCTLVPRYRSTVTSVHTAYSVSGKTKSRLDLHVIY